MYVHDKQNQKTEPFTQLFKDSLRIKRFVNFSRDETPIHVIWNDLDSLSEQTKATVFEKFANGVSSLVNSASVTKETLFNIWKQMYPKAVEDDFKKFVIGLSDMGGHVQWTNASYTETLDFTSGEKEDQEDQA